MVTIYISHYEISSLILRNIDAMQQCIFSQCEIKFQPPSGLQTTFQNAKSVSLSNLNSALEGYLQHQRENFFFSPWKQRVSPVACAQPDKYVSGCEPTSDLRNF
jgi:hypothetical protein